MRIIAGSARGSLIFAPKGTDTRPTQDRVREALFNILQGQVEGARVLDLFAGSGALGLEAVSRGAAHATLCDYAQEPITTIWRNVHKLGFDAQITVIRADWRKAAQRLQRDGAGFSLVFLDPPYRMTETGEMCAALAQAGLLEPDCLVVIEHEKQQTPSLPEGFRQTDARIYRDTAIHFFRYGGGA